LVLFTFKHTLRIRHEYRRPIAVVLLRGVQSSSSTPGSNLPFAPKLHKQWSLWQGKAKGSNCL